MNRIMNTGIRGGGFQSSWGFKLNKKKKRGFLLTDTSLSELEISLKGSYFCPPIEKSYSRLGPESFFPVENRSK